MKYPEIKNRELHRIVVTAIIHKNGEFLIVKRALDKKAWPGRWTVPGGGVEIDDYINTPPTTKNNIWYFALENTLRREIDEEVKLNSENIDYKWVTYEETKKYDLIEGILQEIEMVNKILKCI